MVEIMIKPIKKIIKSIVLIYQVITVNIFYYLLYVFFIFIDKNKKQRKVTIGLTEMARVIYYLGRVISSRYIVNLDRHRFYKDKYDFGPYPKIMQIIIGPFLLAYLSHISEIFIYIWDNGYLLNRKWDFVFLKKKNKKIISLFVGSDIRSLKKTKEYFASINIDTYVNYLTDTDNLENENRLKKLAELTEKYSDIIFNWKYDQISYLEKKTIPWPYMIDTEKHKFNFKMPKDMSEIRIIHAPSNPMIKGTPLVRAAIKKLQMGNYKFKYIEVINIPNHLLLNELENAHIVLQEFYCITPGILGIEAMAAGNAVLMSANLDLNPELPEDSKKAWLVTNYWEIYDNLKYLLDYPDFISKYAYSGREFIENHYSLGKVSEFYNTILNDM